MLEYENWMIINIFYTIMDARMGYFGAEDTFS